MSEPERTLEGGRLLLVLFLGSFASASAGGSALS